MTDRLLGRLKIEELEKLFDEKRQSKDILTSLVAGLSHKKTSRAKDLQRRVMQALGHADEESENNP